MAIITDSYIDNAISEIESSQLHSEKDAQERRGEVLWNFWKFFKGLGRIKGVRPKIQFV